MHHLQVTITGPDAAVAAVAEELAQAGADVLVGADPPIAFCVRDEGPAWLAGITARHDAVTLGVDCFRALGEDRLGLVVRRGEVMPVQRRSIAQSVRAWGRAEDDDGELLDEEVLREAAASVSAVRVDRGRAPLRPGPEATLLLGSALGRLCDAAVGPYEPTAPDGAALRAVRELAAVALTVAASAADRCDAELTFERAWRLAQARVHAGLEPLWHLPGRASWAPWLQDLARSAANALEAASWCGEALDEDQLAVAAEHFPSFDESCDTACRRLVSACLQALALFAEPARGRFP